MKRNGRFGVIHVVCHEKEKGRPVHDQELMAQLFQPGFQQTEQAVPGAASQQPGRESRRIGVFQRSDQLQAQVNIAQVRGYR